MSTIFIDFFADFYDLWFAEPSKERKKQHKRKLCIISTFVIRTLPSICGDGFWDPRGSVAIRRRRSIERRYCDDATSNDVTVTTQRRTM